MPGDKLTEQEKANLAIDRGKTAAGLVKVGRLAPGEATQKFLSAQGEAEKAGKLDRPAATKLSEQGKLALAGYEKGTKADPKTGPAVVHKDEAIIPKDKAKKNRGLIEGLLDGKEAAEEKAEGKKDSPKEEKKEHEKKKTAKKPKHRVHTMHIKRAKGGFIVNHEVEPGEGGVMPTSEENPPHVVSDMAGLHSHMDEHMGGEEEGGGSLAEAQPSPGMPQA